MARERSSFSYQVWKALLRCRKVDLTRAIFVFFFLGFGLRSEREDFFLDGARGGSDRRCEGRGELLDVSFMPHVQAQLVMQ